MRLHHFDRGVATTLLAMLFVTGCDRGPSEPEICADAITLTQPSGLTPGFAWTPQCGVAAVSVATPVVTQFGVQAHVVWAIEAPANQVMAPLSYGSRPWGSTVLIEPEPLLSGRDYVVTIRRWVQVDGGRQLVDVAHGHWHS
jgi:hypothetical protein